MCLRWLSVFLLCLASGARRIVRIENSHQDAEVALFPRGLRMASHRHRNPRTSARRVARSPVMETTADVKDLAKQLNPVVGHWDSLRPTFASRVSTPRMNAAEAAAKAAWLARIEEPSWGPTSASTDINFVHAPISHFALNQLAPKGSRRSQGSLVDVGEPFDFSRPLVPGASWSGASEGNFRVGSWACTAGGWDSPKLRPTTETFLVLDGEGSVTDKDGMAHLFGPGDVVVLPKHWSGRWDIFRDIHKVWHVHDHLDVPYADPTHGVVRAVVAPAPAPGGVPVVHGALYETTTNVAQTIYHVGPTRVGFLSAAPGNLAVAQRASAETLFVVSGVFYLTNLDGSARRCEAGDTVVLPKGWSGYWDILEPTTTVWVEVE